MNIKNNLCKAVNVALSVNADFCHIMSDQIDDFRESLSLIDTELTRSIVDNKALLSRLTHYGSLPVCERSRLIPIYEKHNSAALRLKILFDEIKETSETDVAGRFTADLLRLKLQVLSMLFASSQTTAILRAGIIGKKLPDTTSIHFNFSDFL